MKTLSKPKISTLEYIIILNVFILVTVVAVFFLLLIHNKNKSIQLIDDKGLNRIDLIGARNTLENIDFPSSLYDYKFNEETTGIFSNWDTSTDALGQMCYAIIDGLQYAQNHDDTFEAKLAVTIAENFMSRYKTKLDSKSTSGIPWGGNWYEFSVSSTCMAAYYLLLPNVKLVSLASDLILRIINNPRVSLGYKRDGANCVYMAGPFLLAKYFRGEVGDVWNMPEYKYVINYIKFDIEYKQGVDGLHMDKSYVFHNGLITYAYLQTLDTFLTKYFYKLDSSISESPSTIWYAIREIISHPTIGVSAMGIYGRRPDLSIQTEKNSPLGIKVIPFARYIRYFTEDHQFSMRLLVPWYGFFEADHQYYTQSQYWTQYRTVHTAKSSKAMQFPDAGFICKKDVNQLISIPSTTTTTQVFKPKSADSFVLMYNRYGVAWQSYVIEQFGLQSVTELVIIDSQANTITIHISINNNNDTKPVVYYSVDSKCSLDEYRSKVKPLTVTNGNANFKTYFDLNANTVITTSGTQSINLPLVLENDITIEVVKDIAVLRENNQARVICPKSQFYELPNIIFDDNKLFQFDKISNQYLLNN